MTSTTIINPLKAWSPGDDRVEEFMGPVRVAIQRHLPWPSQEFADIYNRAYEAVFYAITKYDREKVLNEFQKLVKDLPDDVLKDIEQYAEYLKWRRK